MADGAGAAKTWRLGSLTVNRMGFGAMRLPQRGTAMAADAVPHDREAAVAVLRRAVELGINHVDTAAFYFSPLRSANELINSALAPYPNDLVIATKVGPGRDPSGDWLGMARPDQLRGQVEENLRQLGRDHLDLVNLRRIGVDTIAEHVGALADLRTAGLVREVGVSNVRPEHLAEARAAAPIVCVQNRYGLGARDAADDAFVAACGEQGVAFVPFFAIAGSGREGGAAAASPAVDRVAARHGVSPAQVRLAWTLAQGPHVLAIPGTGTVAHLEENVAAGALRLDPEDLTDLADLA